AQYLGAFGHGVALARGMRILARHGIAEVCMETLGVEGTWLIVLEGCALAEKRPAGSPHPVGRQRTQGHPHAAYALIDEDLHDQPAQRMADQDGLVLVERHPSHGGDDLSQPQLSQSWLRLAAQSRRIALVQRPGRREAAKSLPLEMRHPVLPASWVEEH